MCLAGPSAPIDDLMVNCRQNCEERSDIDKSLNQGIPIYEFGTSGDSDESFVYEGTLACIGHDQSLHRGGRSIHRGHIATDNEQISPLTHFH